MSFRFGLAAGLVAACVCQSPSQAQVITHREIGPHGVDVRVGGLYDVGASIDAVEQLDG